MDDLALEFNRAKVSNAKLTEMRLFASRSCDNDPIIRENTAAMLKTLVALKRPARILEAGTSIGYSALLTALTLKELGADFRIDTVEIDEDTAEKAKANFSQAGINSIRVILGDSVEVFSCLSGKYDMIFMDSSKSHYIDMLKDAKRLLNKGGLLVADDIIFYGKSLETPENSPHKHRTIIANLRKFVDAIKSDEDFTAYVDPIDDGVLVAVYNGEKDEEG